MGDRGCGHFISLSVFRIGTISLSVMKSLANSVSEAEDMTTLIIRTIVAGDRVIVWAEDV